MALNKPLEEITEADLQSLKDQSVPEDQSLDYKKGLFLKADPPKDEFRADVTAFANGIGGHLVIGMDEDKGIPTELCGMEITDQDAFTRQIDEVLQNKITPPVPGYKIRYVPVADGKTAIVIRIPQSYAKPHQITVGKDDYQFYVRNSAGKKRLTVDELRSIILRSESLAERIRSFRLERLGNIVSGDTPVKIEEGTRIVLHMIPLSAFGSTPRYDMTHLEDNDRLTIPLTGPEVYSAVQRKYNLDGYLSFLKPMGSKEAWTYMQAFRNGVLEFVDAHSLNMGENGLHESFWHAGHELKIANAIRRGLELQRLLGVEPPVVVILTLLGVRDYNVLTRDNIPGQLFSRDTLNIPEVLLEDFNMSLDDITRPLYDPIWNEAGFRRCQNYDLDGKRIPPR
jgi:hypothetical protein